MLSEAPVTNIEQQSELVQRIQSIFCRILDCKINDIDINKSFFEQGGTSLKALQLMASLQEEISAQLNIHAVLNHLSITGLVHFMNNNT